nr:hypothetical protein [Tanacetum cinerariifolium]
MTETMEEYRSKTCGNYGSGVARPKINDKTHFELKRQFLKELRKNTLSGSEHEDANEHIEKVLEIVDLFAILEEVILFYNGLDVPTRQILDSKGAIPTNTAADAKVAIQEMAEYSQKWHNKTSSKPEMMDYALWEVIENGATLAKTQVVEGVTSLKFNSIKDSKQLSKAIEKRFGRNAVTKKTQRNLLRQQFENFCAPSSEMLDQTLDRLQKLVSQLELLSEKLSQEEDLEQIHPNDMELMDLRWKMAMLTMRARRFLKKTRRKLTVNGNETLGFDMFKVECYNCHKRGHFTKECRAPRNQDNKHKETTKRSMPVETPASIALVSCDGLGRYDWGDQAEQGPNYALMTYTSLSSNSKVSNDFTC